MALANRGAMQKKETETSTLNQKSVPSNTHGLVDAILQVGIVEHDLQPEGLCTLSCGLADTSEANDTELLVSQPVKRSNMHVG